MNNYKFLNISKKSEVNSKFIVILIIFSFLIVGGLFAYDRWWGTKGVSTKFLELEKKERIKVETGTAPKDDWGAMKKIKIPSEE